MVSGRASKPPASGREGDVDHEVEPIFDDSLNTSSDEDEVFTELHSNSYYDDHDADDASDQYYE